MFFKTVSVKPLKNQHDVVICRKAITVEAYYYAAGGKYSNNNVCQHENNNILPCFTLCDFFLLQCFIIIIMYIICNILIIYNAIFEFLCVHDEIT